MTTRVKTVGEILAPYARRHEEDLRRWLLEPGTPAALAEVLEHCVLGVGKRLRPALVHMAAEAAGQRRRRVLTARAGVAVELVHCYSLVHDDLPAMDDDELRHGRPTVHVRYGEAMAILVGDALLTRAFGVLAEAGDGRSSRLAAELARAAGPAGMVAGQVADLGLCGVPPGLEGLRSIHLGKTAALLRAAARMGAICAGADGGTIESLDGYAESIGLAYQVIDDVLDVSATAERLGKTPGKDLQSGKQTYAAVLGVEKARDLGRQLTRQAVESLRPLGRRGRKLANLAELLAERSH